MYQLTWQDQAMWNKHVRDKYIPPMLTDKLVSGASILNWEEHCVECAIPECYSSCPLYVARKDSKCSRFAYGIYPNREVSGLFDFGADIQFRRWAKLEAEWPSSLAAFPISKIKQIASIFDHMEVVINAMADMLQSVDRHRRINGVFTVMNKQLKKWIFQIAKPVAPFPDAFYLKFYYSGNDPTQIQLELLQEKPIFRKNIPIKKGWNEHLIPFADFGCKPGKQGIIQLFLENNAEPRLVFTWLDLVTFLKQDEMRPDQKKCTAPADKVKCLAWDLDNTLWEGVIGDVGPDNVIPNPLAIGMVKQLDERGILQTIVSKNEYEIAWSKIEALGLAEYFLYPAINWGPKSESMLKIAMELDINVDTFALIDDSPFERGEVLNAIPQIRVYDVSEIGKLLEFKEFDVIVTSDGRARRQKYLVEARRKKNAESWRNDYDGFLRSCSMVMRIGKPHGTQKGRCLELLGRSNQFNLSGQKYSEVELDELLANQQYECFAFDVSDIYGDYGTVGFAVFDVSQEISYLVDFVMSCRVAKKKVDETFILWFAQRTQERNPQKLRAKLRLTDRNRPIRDVLSDLGFRTIDQYESEQLLELEWENKIEIPTIIQIVEV